MPCRSPRSGSARRRRRPDGTRFYVGGLDQRRRPLRAGDLDAAIAEAAGLDAADVGQIVDVWRYGSPDPVAVSVDVGG